MRRKNDADGWQTLQVDASNVSCAFYINFLPMEIREQAGAVISLHVLAMELGVFMDATLDQCMDVTWGGRSLGSIYACIDISLDSDRHPLESRSVADHFSLFARMRSNLVRALTSIDRNSSSSIKSDT